MAHVVFLRAANVGGKNVFRPARLAAELSHLDVVNVGAAGTFVVRGKASAAAIRREIVERLPFEPDLSIQPAKDVVALVRSRPFRGTMFSKDLRGWVAALCGRANQQPELPLVVSRNGQWCFRFERIEGSFAIGLWRRPIGAFTLPSNVVEEALGVPATVRWYETYERIVEVLDA